jgi:hypothetical protein
VQQPIIWLTANKKTMPAEPAWIPTEIAIVSERLTFAGLGRSTVYLLPNCLLSGQIPIGLPDVGR